MKKLLALLLVFAATPAFAFHTEETFEEAASTGGASGLYYTGSPRSRQWTCEACHLDAPKQVALSLDAAPPTLFTERRYTPGETYTIRVGLVNETKGIDASANYNTFALEVIDPEQTPTGGFFNFDQALLATVGNGAALFARGQKNIVVTEWTFSWQAPMAEVDYVDFYFAGVDGDGAGDAEVASSNPLGDDVVTGVLRIARDGVTPPPLPRTGEVEGCTTFPGAPHHPLLLLVLIGAWRLGRRREPNR